MKHEAMYKYWEEQAERLGHLFSRLRAEMPDCANPINEKVTTVALQAAFKLTQAITKKFYISRKWINGNLIPFLLNGKEQENNS